MRPAYWYNSYQKVHYISCCSCCKKEITSRYKMSMSTCNKRTKKNLISTIISEVKVKNIPADVEIKPSTIRHTIIRNSIVCKGMGGHRSTLLALEPTFVSTIVQMVDIR